MHYLIDLITTVGYFGYIILFLIVFFESFPMTFFLPGDSLLFTTGFLASQGYFNLPLLTLTIFLGSIFGYVFSYVMGKKVRDFILRSNDKYWFKKKHLDYTHDFFDKYGAKTIIIGRFVPIIRSFGPTLAGTVEMDYRKFLRYNILGGMAWSVSMTSIGFYLGKVIPGVDKYLSPIILLIIIISMMPTVYEYFAARKNKREVKDQTIF